MAEQMTVKDVLIETIKILNNISVPVSLADKVTSPILGCIRNLNACVQALPEPQHEPQPEPEPEASEEEDTEETADEIPEDSGEEE